MNVQAGNISVPAIGLTETSRDFRELGQVGPPRLEMQRLCRRGIELIWYCADFRGPILNGFRKQVSRRKNVEM